eukprot:jgi/Astpho2/6791/Aster-07235
MEDGQTFEKMQLFNREKVPERVVHARGFTVKGSFEVTDGLKDVTCAGFLQEGVQTPVAHRFSTVTHEKGSPEDLRDVRGFSTKFYTSQGNWDLVGNSIPVFFIRDGAQFPDLVHALRPNPKSHVQEAWRILDFLSNYPESTHILTWLLDYHGIPKSWRHMEGYGVNTFVFINDQGAEKLVKFHWRPTIGFEGISDTQAQAKGMNNMRHSAFTHDLYNAIAGGDYPEWTFYVQLMDPEEQDKLDFDPLDATKYWPEEQFPLRKVGRMVLDKVVDNFHNESEQIAFSPHNLVPGITFSNDKVLQSRVFAYQDAQRYRIGTHYNMLPINQPRCPFHFGQEDGAQNWMHRDEEINYQPSTIRQHSDSKIQPHPDQQLVAKEEIRGQRTRGDYPPQQQSDFQQAGDRYRSFDPVRRGFFETHVTDWLADEKLPDLVRKKWLDMWTEVDSGLGSRLRAEVAAMTGAKGIKDKIEDTLSGNPTKEHVHGTTKA